MMNYRARQRQEVIDTRRIVTVHGKYSKGASGNGAHYIEENPFAGQGIACGNCIFFQQSEGGSGRCDVVEGFIDPTAICKKWVIPESTIA